jgi:hypothetical protein
MTDTKTPNPSTAAQVKQLVGLIKTAVLGRVAIDPIDKDAPFGTQIRRIAAYNALQDLAKPGADRFCGSTRHTRGGQPCVLRDGHLPSQFDATFHPGTSTVDTNDYRCLSADGRERALRYLVHSDPDPDKRA